GEGGDGTQPTHEQRRHMGEDDAGKGAVRPRTRRYIPVCQLTGTRTAHYRAVPPKSFVDSRFRPSTVDFGRNKKEEKKKREKNTSPAAIPRFPHERSKSAGKESSVSDSFSPCGEKDRGDKLDTGTRFALSSDKALYQAVCTNPSADRNKREKNTLHTTLPRFPHTVRHLRAKNCPRDLRPRAIPSPHAGRRNIILHYIPSIMHCAYRLVPGTVLYRDTYRSAS
ncbi:hypothetical protein BHE74_00018353, partial [Ensete ventricosum]